MVESIFAEAQLRFVGPEGTTVAGACVRSPPFVDVVHLSVVGLERLIISDFSCREQDVKRSNILIAESALIVVYISDFSSREQDVKGSNTLIAEDALIV